MNILGWIRVQDQAACGGTVLEGDPHCTGGGLAYAFQGAKVDCKNHCVITDGYAASTLTNGCSKVIHGMRTSGGCPLKSTLNGIDGAGQDNDEPISDGFIQDHRGQWVGNSAGVSTSIQQACDEQFLLLGGDGQPLTGTYYTARLASGELIHGETDEHGRTQRFCTAAPQPIEIHLGHLEA